MSSKKKIYITREIPEEAVKFLKNKGFEVTVNKKDRPVTRKELLTNLRESDAVIPMLTDKFDKELIDKITRCRVIANYAVGYNNIDVKYALEKGIIVTNTPDVLTDSTADLAITLVLACTRRLFESEETLRSGKYKGWKPKLLLGAELKN